MGTSLEKFLHSLYPETLNLLRGTCEQTTGNGNGVSFHLFCSSLRNLDKAKTEIRAVEI